MKVKNVVSASSGKAVANQFITVREGSNGLAEEFFQSYDTVIAKKAYSNVPGKGLTCFVTLDRRMWDCSVTTGRYRNQFLGEKKAETQMKINSGVYVLADLN